MWHSNVLVHEISEHSKPLSIWTLQQIDFILCEYSSHMYAITPCFHIKWSHWKLIFTVYKVMRQFNNSDSVRTESNEKEKECGLTHCWISTTFYGENLLSTFQNNFRFKGLRWSGALPMNSTRYKLTLPLPHSPWTPAPPVSFFLGGGLKWVENISRDNMTTM